MTVRTEAITVLVIGREQRRSMAAGRDNEVDADLGAGHGLERLLDEAGEPILEPVLRQLARDTDAECAAVRRHDRSVLEPHVVRALGQLKSKLLLDLGPDLILVHVTPSPIRLPAGSASESAPRRSPPPGNNGPPTYAYAVHNLGQTGGSSSPHASASRSVFGLDSSAHVQPKTFDCSGPPPVYLWIRSEQISTGWGSRQSEISLPTAVFCGSAAVCFSPSSDRG